jgi:hypothetical protein
VLVAYLTERDRLLEAERDRVLHDVLDQFAAGLSPGPLGAARAGWATPSPGAATPATPSGTGPRRRAGAAGGRAAADVEALVPAPPAPAEPPAPGRHAASGPDLARPPPTAGSARPCRS